MENTHSTPVIVHRDNIEALREKIARREEVVCPTDCSIFDAVMAMGRSGGRILVKDGEHSWEGLLDIRCQGLILRGEVPEIPAAKPGLEEPAPPRCPKVLGRWHFADGEGIIQSLELSNRDEGVCIEQGVLSISGGKWRIEDCLVRCSAKAKGKGEQDDKKRQGKHPFTGFDVALHSSGGEIALQKCRIGGFGSTRTAYHSIYITKNGKVVVEDTILCNCYGTAVEVREFGEIQIQKCEIKRNDTVFSAGYPNQAVMRLDRNRVFSNGRIWKKCRPMTIEDTNMNTDRMGYSVSLFPDT